MPWYILEIDSFFNLNYLIYYKVVVVLRDSDGNFISGWLSFQNITLPSTIAEVCVLKKALKRNVDLDIEKDAKYD